MNFIVFLLIITTLFLPLGRRRSMSRVTRPAAKIPAGKPPSPPPAGSINDPRYQGEIIRHKDGSVSIGPAPIYRDQEDLSDIPRPKP